MAPLSSLLAPPRNGQATYYRAARLDESVMAASSLATKSSKTRRPLIQRTTVTISFPIYITLFIRGDQRQPKSLGTCSTKKLGGMIRWIWIAFNAETAKAGSHSTRGVAQPGSAPGSGPGGRRFKSSRPDHLQNPARHWFTLPFLISPQARFVDQCGPTQNPDRCAPPIAAGTPRPL